jgi:GH25 family lysozyme M1 (1,4-beta-N-acetylmuramidase)
MPSSTFVLEGIDVSSNQGPVDWKAVMTGTLSFAYLRATIGSHPPIPSLLGIGCGYEGRSY